MSSVGMATGRYVLHLRAERSGRSTTAASPADRLATDGSTPDAPSTDNVIAALAAASIPERIVSDVYRALACICGSGGEGIAAVVVNIAAVGPDEWEFFTLASRQSAGPPVFVYGGIGREPQIAQAIQMGATGRWSEEHIRRLAGEAALAAAVAETREARRPLISLEEPEVEAEEVEGQPAWGLPTTRDSFVSPGWKGEEENEPPTEESEAVSEVEAGAASDEGEPAIRVPWMRYEDRPARARPSTSKPVPPEPAMPEPAARERAASDSPMPEPAKPEPLQLEPTVSELPTLGREALEPPAIPMVEHVGESRGRRGHEPLLTEEELRALLEDDIAAIVPRSRPEMRPSERGEEDAHS